MKFSTKDYNRYLVKAFCKEYPINRESNEAGEPGILIGRYPNDGYAGGNPWQLLTAVTAECFYVGASITYKVIDYFCMSILLSVFEEGLHLFDKMLPS